MKYLLVATTSINRPALHSNIFYEWIDWILEVKTKYPDVNIKWFINIDFIEKLELSLDHTEKNFQKIIENRISTIFFRQDPEKKSSFLLSCKRLSENIVSYVETLNTQPDDIKIIWLEDDWKLNTNAIIPLSQLISMYSSSMTYINLTFIRNNYIWALAPSIISYTLWKSLFYTAWKLQDTEIDPEHCVGVYYNKVFGKPNDLFNITLYNRKIGGDFLNQKYLNYKNSYYSTNLPDNMDHSTQIKYISNGKLKEFIEDKVVFIRITPTFCVDYGRKFLEKYNVKKTGDTSNFYNLV
jgi:hypothetical protein